LSRDPERRLDDIIRCCEKILRFTAGMDQTKLMEQELVMDAVLRNIEIIGEATKNLPNSVREQMPGIEWKKIAGMRDWLSHVYDRIDFDTVWDVVETRVPELLRTIQAFKDKNKSP
jgi:uncharacterized protein with HEPN domain